MEIVFILCCVLCFTIGYFGGRRDGAYSNEKQHKEDELIRRNKKMELATKYEDIIKREG